MAEPSRPSTGLDVVPVGRVAGPYGVRGWLRVRSDTDPPEGLLDHGTWLIGGRGGWAEHHLAEGRRHGAGLVVRLEGVTDRDAAGAFAGRDVGVARDALPALEDGEYYWADLIGLEVRNAEGVALGTVVRMMETGANDVLVVDGERERLVPYLPDRVVRRVDLAAGRIEVDWAAED